MRRLACALLLAGVTAAAASAQLPSVEVRPIATIDFYGLRTLDPDMLRQALPMHEGDPLGRGDAGAAQKTVTAVRVFPHVEAARLDLICCAQGGGVHVFVGVQEEGSPVSSFRPAPKGKLRLPKALMAADAAAWTAEFKAISEGRAGEDRSHGHSLSEDPTARALQEKLPPLARRNLTLLRKVLRTSADGEQRALAARYLGYAPDKQAVVKDLVRGVTDPYPGVRNDSTRALVVFAQAKRPPRIPATPFVALLEAPTWTDLNKGSSVLATLSASRDPKLLAELRRRSLPTLAAMARWHDRDHSLPAYQLLGRVGGLSETQIQDLWDKADAEAVIAAAMKSAG
jgi:hypothetical protein